jgi:hypothetical protein
MNFRNVSAVLLILIFLILFYCILSPTPAFTVPGSPATMTAVGTALWKGRTFEALLQGFIILAGVMSILLLLVVRNSKGEAP